MKKEMLILTVLFLGLSLKSFAGTGSAKDGFEFLLVIFGSLLIIIGLLFGVDFLKKNGKTMLNKAISFFKNKITTLRSFRNKMKAHYFNLSYNKY